MLFHISFLEKRSERKGTLFDFYLICLTSHGDEGINSAKCCSFLPHCLRGWQFSLGLVLPKHKTKFWSFFRILTSCFWKIAYVKGKACHYLQNWNFLCPCYPVFPALLLQSSFLLSPCSLRQLGKLLNLVQ